MAAGNQLAQYIQGNFTWYTGTLEETFPQAQYITNIQYPV